MLQSPFEEVIQKIKDVEIINDPFPHFIIDNIFPKELYDEILEKLPTINEYVLKSKYPGRKTLTLDSPDNLGEEKKKFWNKMNKWLKSEEFAKVLLEKYSERVHKLRLRRW